MFNLIQTIQQYSRSLDGAESTEHRSLKELKETGVAHVFRQQEHSPFESRLEAIHDLSSRARSGYDRDGSRQ